MRCLRCLGAAATGQTRSVTVTPSQSGFWAWAEMAMGEGLPSSVRISTSRSQAFSERDITTVATALLARLVKARASDMKRSIPISRARPAKGMS